MSNSAWGKLGNCHGCPVIRETKIGSSMEWIEGPYPVGLASLRPRQRDGDLEWQGPWTEEVGYLPIRVERYGEQFYGWIRLSCSYVTGEVEIKDFYLNEYSEAPVYAGTTQRRSAP